MKISKRTLDVLAQFSDVNDTLILTEGNVIQTQPKSSDSDSSGKQVHIMYHAPETFPKKCGIQNLRRALNIVKNMDGDVDFTFSENVFTISDGTIKADLALSASEMCVDFSAKEEHFMEQDNVPSFSLGRDSLKKIKSLSSIMISKMVLFEGDGRSVKLKTAVSDNAMLSPAQADSQESVSIYADETDSEFHVKVALDNIMIMEIDYMVYVLPKYLLFIGDVEDSDGANRIAFIVPASS